MIGFGCSRCSSYSQCERDRRSVPLCRVRRNRARCQRLLQQLRERGRPSGRIFLCTEVKGMS